MDTSGTFVVPDSVDDDRVLPKRLRHSEPDCKVIVGGQVFYHYKTMLACASDYFDAMFASGMNDSNSCVFEFPEKDPEEWKQVAKFFDAAGPIDLAERDLSTLVPWFSELQMTQALAYSDNILTDHVVEICGDLIKSASRSEGYRLVGALLENAVFSNTYSLSSALDECMSVLKEDVLEGEIKRLPLDSQSIGNLITILKDERPRSFLMPSILNLFHESVRDADPKELVESPYFLGMIVQAAKLKSLAPPVVSGGFSFGRAPAANVGATFGGN